MEKIILYSEELPHISIHMSMYFNEKGQLIFDGQDLGKRVEEYWGDSDYEYTYTVEPQEVEKMFPLFGIPNADRHLLLLEIQKRFGGKNKAYTLFGDFMKENNINYYGSTWA
jgi:hypothetical protein